MKQFLILSTQLKRPSWLVIIGVAFVFLVNGLYVAYPDEFVNLLGARAVAEGLYPYRDFFDHHLPMAWFLGADLLKLSWGNFVVFRVFLALFMFGVLLFTGLSIRKTNRDLFPFFLAFFAVYPFFAVYFWLHTFLADSLATLFFSCAFWLTISETFRNRSQIGIIVIIAFFNFALVFSSLTYFYLTGVLYLWLAYLVWRDHRNPRDISFFLFMCALPYLYYAVSLLLTNTWLDFYRSNYVYNTQHYIVLEGFERGQRLNPVKFAMNIINNFWDDYLPLLSKIKHLDLYLPINTLAGLSTLLLMLALACRNPFLGAVFLLILSFSAPRSDIREYAETNYQMGVFLALGLASACVVMYLSRVLRFSYEYLNIFKHAMVAVVTLLFLFTGVFLFKNTYEKAFKRYTLQMPGIVNRSFIAEFLEEFLPEGEYFWIGPYEPHHSYFVRSGRLPGKYPTLLPQFRESDYYRTDFIAQFEKHPPAVIIFKNEASIFMTPAVEFGAFFLEWMDDRYVRVRDIPNVSQLRTPPEITLMNDVYIRKDKWSALIERLEALGYVRRQ